MMYGILINFIKHNMNKTSLLLLIMMACTCTNFKRNNPSDMNGDNWTPPSITFSRVSSNVLFEKKFDHSCIVFDKKLWVIAGGGKEGGGLTNEVWSSSDGVHWEKVTDSAEFSIREGHASVVYNDKMWVIGGWLWSHTGNDGWWSSDGKIWAQATDYWGME